MDLRSSINRLRTLFIISYVLIGVFAITMFSLVSNAQHKQLASVLAMSVRNSLVIHDLRQAILNLNPSVGENFDRIVFKAGEETVFSLPSQSASQSRLQSLLTLAFTVNIESDPSIGDELGQITFYYSLIEPISLGVAAWLLLLSIAIPLFDYARGTLETKHNDIVARKSAETALKIAEQVAHDIRSPLSALNIFAEISTGVPDDQKSLLKLSINRINNIADDLLFKHKASGGINLSPVDAVIKDLVDETNQTLKGRKIQFTGEEAHAVHEQSGLIRVVSNLIENAIEATSTEGQVFVTVKDQEKFVEIAVADDGHGIPSEIINKIGTRGFTTKTRGHGLGLAGAIELVRPWGGEIKFEPRQPKGTIVRVLLPKNKPLRVI